MGLYDFINAENISAYWETTNANSTDKLLGEGLFPNKKMAGLQLAWIKGKNGTPVALQPSTFDANAQYRDRIGVEKIETELPFFREAMLVKEKERQLIGQYEAYAPALAEPVIQNVYNDAKQLIDGALVQSERMRMALIQTAAINIVGRNDSGRVVSYTYNYDTDGSWATSNKTTLTGTAKWTVANASTSTPIQDMLTIITTASTNGTIIKKILMNSATFNGMMASESITKAMDPNGNAYIITNNQKKLFIEDMLGAQIVIYDKQFVDENGTTTKYLADNIVSFIPDEVLGNTYYSVTPEEFELLSENTSAECKVVNTGIAVTTIKKPHPVNVETIVSEIVLPSFEAIDKVYVCVVA